MAKKLSNKVSIHKAAEKGDISLVQQLLDSGENVNSPNYKGFTPLELASRNGHDALVRFFLQRGVSQDPQDSQTGYTPLHHACNSGHETTVSVLIAGGANVNAQDHIDGYTPLHVACFHNHGGVAKILLEKGANINIQTHNGFTALICASSIDDEETARLLLDHGANVNLQENNGKTALNIASLLGHTSVVDPLLEAGAKVYLKDHRGNTPLHRAAEENALRITSKLLDKGASIDEKNYDGETPFDLMSTSFGSYGNILLDYIRKLKMARVPVKIDLPEEEYMENMHLQWLPELEKIKERKVDGPFSLNVLFHKFTNPFYLSDSKLLQSLEEVVQSPELVEQFPVYVGVLKYVFENTKRRFFLLANASQSLDKMWMKMDSSPSCLKNSPTTLPELVKRQILGYLSEVDLDILITTLTG